MQDKQCIDAPGSKKASTTKENVVSENSNSIKKVANKNSGIAVKVSGNIDEMKQKLLVNHTKGNKNDKVSTIKEAKTSESLLTEIKSPFAERTNPPAKRRKIDMPVSKGSEVTPSKVVFQYKGIRGGEDTELTNSPGNLTDTEKGQRNIEEGDKDVLTFPSVHVLKYAEREESCNGADMFYACESFQTDTSFEAEPVSWDENFTEKISRGRKRSRGRGSRRKVNTTGVYFYGGSKFADIQPTRGRGRGSREKVNTPSFNVGDITSPDRQPARGQGRGRGRGRGRGEAKNKRNIQR